MAFSYFDEREKQCFAIPDTPQGTPLRSDMQVIIGVMLHKNRKDNESPQAR
jgi:hypothetical protein